MFEREYGIKTVGCEDELFGFTDQEFELRAITEDESAAKAYRLRHEIFAEELKWVPTAPDGLEVDDYDDLAVHLGVFDKEEQLLAYMRVIVPGQPFMMENEFQHLVGPNHKIRRGPDTAEISRLCVAPIARNDTVSGNFGMHSTSILILKGLYCWSMLHGVNYIYAETEEKVYRLFKLKGFPWKAIGKPVIMPDGIKAVAIMMSWQEFVDTNRYKRPEMLEWFNQALSNLSAKLSPQHECGLMHPVSV